MVILKNIIKTEDNISADYYPEGKAPKGYMQIRLSDGKVVEFKGNEYSMAPSHVRRELRRLAEKKAEEIPKEKVLLWY